MLSTSKALDVQQEGFSDKHWDEMVHKAIAYQQDFYELLPSWTACKKDDVKFIKQNIGYAIFGSPFSKKTSDSRDIVNFEIDDISDDMEIHEIVHYNPEAVRLIDKIFNIIWIYGGWLKDDSINYGIVYNILFRNKMEKPSSKDEEEELIAIPVFKIQHYDDNPRTKSNKNNEDIYTVWYIDIKGRVYKNWEDYIKNNNLPKCTMVFPKDGYYQPNPQFEIHANNSIVWVTVKDSYMCSSRANIISKVKNTISTVGTAATVGIGVASLFTPASPIVFAAGIATMGVNVVSTIGESSLDLYDKAVHKESISLFNRSSLSAWLNITGITVGIALCGSTALLKKATSAGVKVHQIALSAHNVMAITSVSINLIGVGYKGYQIIEKYKNERKVDIEDIVYLGTHLLFFVNFVVNVKFAKQLIESTQGDILRKIEAELREDNLRQQYDYAKNKIDSGNRIVDNAAIIRQFHKVMINDFTTNNNCLLATFNGLFSTENGKIKLNGITLLDPLLFVTMVGKGLLRGIDNMMHYDSDTHADRQTNVLTKSLETLLTDLYTSRNDLTTENIPAIPQFHSLIMELKKIDRSENILPLIFNTAVIILKNRNQLAYLVEGCRFVWDYVKLNIKEAGYELLSIGENRFSYNDNRVLELFFTTIFDAMDLMVQCFFNALQKYIEMTRKSQYDQ